VDASVEVEVGAGVNVVVEVGLGVALLVGAATTTGVEPPLHPAVIAAIARTNAATEVARRKKSRVVDALFPARRAAMFFPSF